MAGLRTSAVPHFHIVIAMVLAAVYYASGIMAQDIAPSPALQTGSGFALPVSGVLLCSSVLVSLIALWLQ